MNKILLLITPLILLFSCQNQTIEPTENTSWVFVANEGDFGASNGSISMIDENGNVLKTEEIGDVVQSLEVYGDKLIVLINNSHKIKIYDITSNGLSMPGIEISTNNSSPRDLIVINDKVYFTNWNTKDIKVFNLFNYTIETSISVQGLPENIEFDGQYLWVTIPHTDNIYFGTANTVVKIDPNTNSLIETIEVGDGPQEIAFKNGEVYISRTSYDENYNASHGATKIIGNEITINNYGLGAACGGSILSYETNIYRSFDGGLAKMNSALDLDLNHKIGNFNQSQVYHVEENNGNIWFAITDYNNLNEVHVIDFNGNHINSYEVGQTPGDFAFWEK